MDDSNKHDKEIHQRKRISDDMVDGIALIVIIAIIVSCIVYYLYNV